MQECVCVCMCLMLSFKRGNMLSLGIRGSGSLKEPCNTVTSRNIAFIQTMVDYFTQMPPCCWFTLKRKESSQRGMAKTPEPPLFSQATAAGPPCLSRKPQMSGKPLDISANHSPLNKYFLNDLRDNETGVRPTTQPNKAPRLWTNLNPN